MFNHSVSYLVHTFLRPLNDKILAEMPVSHNLLHAFCHPMAFLASQSPFSVIVQTSRFSSCVTCLFAVKSLLIFSK